MRHQDCSESVTSNRFSLPLLMLLVGGVSLGAFALPTGAYRMPAKKLCRTFHDPRQFALSLSPASRMAPGDSRSTDASGFPAFTGGAATRLPQPRWRIELLRRPLRRINTWCVTDSLYHGMPVKDYSEVLECGHEQMAFYFEGDKPAKRRRCRECGRAA